MPPRRWIDCDWKIFANTARTKKKYFERRIHCLAVWLMVFVRRICLLSARLLHRKKFPFGNRRNLSGNLDPCENFPKYPCESLQQSSTRVLLTDTDAWQLQDAPTQRWQSVVWIEKHLGRKLSSALSGGFNELKVILFSYSKSHFQRANFTQFAVSHVLLTRIRAMFHKLKAAELSAPLRQSSAGKKCPHELREMQEPGSVGCQRKVLVREPTFWAGKRFGCEETGTDIFPPTKHTQCLLALSLDVKSFVLQFITFFAWLVLLLSRLGAVVVAFLSWNSNKNCLLTQFEFTDTKSARLTDDGVNAE